MAVRKTEFKRNVEVSDSGNAYAYVLHCLASRIKRFTEDDAWRGVTGNGTIKITNLEEKKSWDRFKAAMSTTKARLKQDPHNALLVFEQGVYTITTNGDEIALHACAGDAKALVSLHRRMETNQRLVLKNDGTLKEHRAFVTDIHEAAAKAIANKLGAMQTALAQLTGRPEPQPSRRKAKKD